MFPAPLDGLVKEVGDFALLSELCVLLCGLRVEPIWNNIRHNSNAEIAEADAEIAERKTKPQMPVSRAFFKLSHYP